MRCTVRAASSKAKALEAAAHTANLRANRIVEEQSAKLSVFTEELEEGYRQMEKRLRVNASAQISTIAEMRRDVAVVNQMTGPSMMQDGLCADVLAWR